MKLIVIMDLVSLRYSWEELYFIINYRNDLPVFIVYYIFRHTCSTRKEQEGILIHYTWNWIFSCLPPFALYLLLLWNHSRIFLFSLYVLCFSKEYLLWANGKVSTHELLQYDQKPVTLVNWLKEGLFQGKLLISGS